MAVNSTHPEFECAFPKWRRCRDAYGGTDNIKHAILAAADTMESRRAQFQARGRASVNDCEYLPKLDGQTPEQYRAYVNRALWYGATKRTVQGLSGAVFRKDPHIEVPDKIEPQIDDVTMDGDVTLAEFSKKLLIELLVTGRAGVLVDMPGADETIAPADRRPYWVVYKAEQIIDWKTKRVGGKTMLSLVVLEEHIEVDGDDEFEESSTLQYRVLKLDDQNQYTVEIWKETEKKDDKGATTQEFQIGETITPTNLGNRLKYIPFCFFGPTGLGSEVDTPPLLDLVDVNLSHYRSTADYEHGLHYTALPTPYALGFPDGNLVIGPANVWRADEPDGQVGYLEFKGEGLKQIASAITEKETKMAALGARLLEQQNRAGVEAAESIRLRQSGEHGALQGIATTLSQGLTKCLGWHAEWIRVAGDPKIELNKDFFDVEMPPLLLQQLLGALQSGTLSYETFYYNLQKGELARPGVTAEEEQALIQAEAEQFEVEDDPATQQTESQDEEDTAEVEDGS